MNARAIQSLARFFTGGSVAHHSINLGIPGIRATAAQEYFALRELLGVRGYDTTEEAAKVIERALYGDPR